MKAIIKVPTHMFMLGSPCLWKCEKNKVDVKKQFLLPFSKYRSKTLCSYCGSHNMFLFCYMKRERELVV